MTLSIALIAHDNKKDAIVALAREFAPFLRQCRLCATGTTGQRLIDEVGLDVERMLSATATSITLPAKDLA